VRIFIDGAELVNERTEQTDSTDSAASGLPGIAQRRVLSDDWSCKAVCTAVSLRARPSLLPNGGKTAANAEQHSHVPALSRRLAALLPARLLRDWIL